jgi:hypothetical protein
MLAAHWMDNRPGITSIKFQTWVRYGVSDYDTEADPYKKSVGKGGNAFNKIAEMPLKPLLQYNALDCLFEFRCAEDQASETGVDLWSL